MPAIKSHRQALADIGGNTQLSEHDGIGFDGGVDAERHRRDTQRKSRIQPVCGTRDQRNEARRAGLVGCDIDDADRRCLGKARKRQEQLVCLRDGGKRIADRIRDPLAALRESGSGRNHARPLAKGSSQRSITRLRPRIDEQNVDRQSLRLQRGDRLGEARKCRPIERITVRPSGAVVDRNDRDDGRRCFRADDGAADIGKRGLHPVEKAASGIEMGIAERSRPKTGEQQRDHGQ